MPPVPLFFRRIQFALHYRRIADSQRIGRNISGHDTARPDNAAVTDRHSGKNDRSSPNPAVLSNRYRIRIFFRLPPFPIIKRMMRRINLHIGSNLRIIAYCNAGAVQKGASGVDIDMFPQPDPMSVVTMKRRNHNRC